MKSFLLYKDRDFPWEEEISKQMETAFNDLEMDALFKIMADDSKEIYENSRKVFARILKDKEEINYRQEILKDCLSNHWIFYELKHLMENIRAEQSWLNRRFGLLKDYPTSVMTISTEMIQIYIESLRYLKRLFDENRATFVSEGFRRLYNQLDREADDAFDLEVTKHLNKLEFKEGLLVNATLGTGLKADNFIISDATEEKDGWVKSFFKNKNTKDVIQIKFKNDNSARALSDLKEQALSTTAGILHQTVDHLSNFFEMFEREISFYNGLINLDRFLKSTNQTLSFPEVGGETCKIENLFDVSLAVIEGDVTTNDFDSQGKPLTFITGANQGGKTTFLRSLGQAILMAQVGSFVGASECHLPIYEGVFTFFRKEEDNNEESGKFDEELKRFSSIINKIRPGSCLLMNEPFASTNEKEGTEIGYNIIKALIEKDITVFCVTHLFSLTNKFESLEEDTVFLRASRNTDGTRSFKITPHEPLKTGFGMDLYKQIFLD